MILSVSRKTDIPAFYSDWFYNRIKEGFCYTQNPMNTKQFSKVLINTDVVDAIVFWTKNPKSMLARIDEIKKFPYYFQFTINSYTTDIEAHLPKKIYLIETFKALSDKIGNDRVVWRYDPILLNNNYTIDYHIKHFETIAKALCGYTNKVVISYIDFYRKISKNWNELAIKRFEINDKNLLADALSTIAQSYNLKIETCSEDIDLAKYNINHAKCIDDGLLEKIIKCRLNVKKDDTQRESCGCVKSVDIGIYNSCSNGCKYCYASFSEESIKKNIKQHDKNSPLLLGKVPEGIIIKERKQVSLIDKQNYLC